MKLRFTEKAGKDYAGLPVASARRSESNCASRWKIAATLTTREKVQRGARRERVRVGHAILQRRKH